MNQTPFSYQFAEAIEAKFNAQFAEQTANDPRGYTYPDISVQVQPGRTYDKIVQSRGEFNNSVHAFVVKATGELVKAAGWNAPQKNSDGSLAVRYDLSTEEGFNAAVEVADWYGGYLYKR